PGCTGRAEAHCVLPRHPSSTGSLPEGRGRGHAPIPPGGPGQSWAPPRIREPHSAFFSPTGYSAHAVRYFPQWGDCSACPDCPPFPKCHPTLVEWTFRPPSSTPGVRSAVACTLADPAGQRRFLGRSATLLHSREITREQLTNQ